MTDATENTGPDPIDLAVGLRIRNLRKDKGLSQSALATALGMTFQQVQKYERGTNRISASVLVKTARFLGVSPASLLPNAGEPDTTPPAIMRVLGQVRGAEDLLNAYAAIPAGHQRRAVLQLARTLSRGEKVEEEPDVEE